MAEYFFITDETRQWFLPLLPEQEQRVLKQDLQAYAVGAVEGSTACGILMFHLAEQMAQISYVVVADDYRRKGIGTGMVQYLCRLLDEDDILVHCVFAASGTEDPVYQFFSDMWNFSVAEEEGYYCRIPFSSLKENKLLASMRGKGGAVVPFFSLPEEEQDEFFEQHLEEDVYFLQDIPEEAFAKELCVCCKTDAGSISAAVFLTREDGDEELEIACAWGASGGQKDMMGLFAHIGAQLSEREKGSLNIAAVTEASVSLVEKILPEREIIRRYYLAAWDMEL